MKQDTQDRPGRDRTYSITDLCREFNVTPRTLRFYEQKGLLSPARRGWTRLFSYRDRARLQLILRGKRFGMSLAEIREIVDMYDGAASSERRQLAMLLARLDNIAADLRARQSALQRTLDEVNEVAARCRTRLAELDG
jgi:DNA-binding transcriptional MerR regulator